MRNYLKKSILIDFYSQIYENQNLGYGFLYFPHNFG